MTDGTKKFKAPSDWTLAQRLNHYTDKSGGPDSCWPWTGALQGGYGIISFNRRYKLAHRAAYEEFVGPIPAGECVCHSCDNPPCINPNHLWTGTNQDNVDDCVKKGRQINLRGSKHGNAVLTEDIVRDIRASEEPNPILAERYGVHHSQISNIRLRKQWAHVK